MTLGLLRLVLYWKPNWLLYCTHNLSSNLNDCNKVLLKDKYKQFFVEEVKTIDKDDETDFTQQTSNDINVLREKQTQIRFFMNKKWRYIYDEIEENFFRLK